MSLHDVFNLTFDFHGQKSISVEPVAETLSSDAGLLIFRQFDELQDLTRDFAGLIDDTRRAPVHTILEMVRSRIYGIIAGYEDQNDHGALRSDGVFKLLADRLPDDDDLASQPTLSRFENSVTPSALLRMEQWFIDRFVDSFEKVPQEITLDVDIFDDPTHGNQQLTLFHGFYGQYQYEVRVVTCAENDSVVMPVLLHGTANPGLGFHSDLERIVLALRERFPHVLIHLRADSGFASPQLYQACERLQIEYSIGIGMNARIRRYSEELLSEACQGYAEASQPQRLFTGFDYQAGTWACPRWVVVKCEVNAQGTNRRAVVTNRPGGRVLPQGVYDEYAKRGESENRNKELKCDLSADRLSDHRYMANCFRMFLHCLAHNLLISLRQLIASPPIEVEPAAELPAEARTGRQRRQGFNQRRDADPLGEGHACTWRLRLIKVAARIKVTARRVRVFLSSSWPYLHHFRDVGQAVAPSG